MLTMSVTLSPLRSQDLDPMATDASPMAINLTPTVEQGEGEEAMKDMDSDQQYEKPPPLHTGADWKIVLHLPEIETWLRMTSERVRDLTYSVQQDSDSKHVDVHLVQLKDICEDISDHVEQIHALLETEFSLKLLSYSVSVIVDIHAVQLLWHQLRVSVLVLRERILQGLQDANGNYTRQTDILQAFSEETKEDRLDALTEVDDSGQLTIKCSQNYLSLDCGITAFELSDYSPSEDLLSGLGDMTSSQVKTKPFDSWSYSEMEKEFPELIRSVGLLTVAPDAVPSNCSEAVSEEASQVSLSADDRGGCEENNAATVEEQPGLTQGLSSSGEALTNAGQPSLETVKQESDSSSQLGAKNQQPLPCENATPKRSIRDCFNYNEDSPTQPTLPKRGLFLKEETFPNNLKGTSGKKQMVDLKPELSRSSPSLVDPRDRSKLCLLLQSSYPSTPSAASHSYECLHKVGDGNLENTVKSHIKEISSSLGRLNDGHKEKLRLEKPHKTVEEVPSCQTPKREPSSGKQAKNTRSSVVPHGIPSSTSKAIEGPETDSASTSSLEPYNQSSWNAKLPVQSETSSSPPFSQSSESSAGSDNVMSPVPLLSENKSKKSYTSSPSHVTRNGQVVEAWYGSDEYLALPSHLKQTEVLALKLENLTKLLPQKPRGETIQNIDDWELSEMNSDSEIYPTYHVKKKHTRLGRVSPSSSSDIASSLGESIESGPLSDLPSDEELCVPLSGMKKYIDEKSERASSSEKNESHSATKSALIQKLMQDIQHQDNYEAIWEKIEGFVNKLDEFIQWLNEAMETTENWTPPKAEMDGLKLYLETHLSFKLNVDSHCALKEAVEEEGHQLLELIASHKAEGLKDMLRMIASQWKELQRQIKRQHSWILRALDTIKAEILATDVSVEGEEGTGSPKAEVQLCYLEAQRDAVEQMSLKLYSEQYTSSSKRKEEFADMSKVHSVGGDGLLDFDSEYQELWDWLIDMESLVMDSHDLMMSEEQQQHLYKRYSVEMSIRDLKKTELLSKVEALKKGGVLLPNDLLEKVDSINEKWELLGKTLGEKIQDTMAGHSGSGARDLLSPESGSLVRQLEVRIKELKGWLRDTELFIFNSCLRQEKEGTMNAEKQLQYFKSLCCEIKQRRRGVASILRLCQHLLDDRETCNLNADHQPMQLIIVNLERRWEAIVMQAVQWQTRLQKKMGKEPETLNVIDPGLMDLNGTSEDALEWDETDISNKLISLNEESKDLDQESQPVLPSLKLEETGSEDPGYEEEVGDHGASQCASSITALSSPHIYQVYSLHNVELYEDNHIPFLKNSPNFTSMTQSSVLTKSLSKDSSFSSTKSLPDLLGGSNLVKPCPCHGGDMSQNSGSESGIVSEGDTETTTNSEMCLHNVVDGSPSNPETEHLDPQMGDAVNVLKQKFKDEEEQIKLPNSSQLSISPVGCVNGKVGDLNSVTKHTPDCLGEELQGKHDVFTFYDYSYLQGSKLKLPMIMKQSQSEKAHVEDPLLHGFYFDKKSCKSKHQATELQPDAPPHERILASASHEMDRNSYKSGDVEKTFTGMQNAKQLSLLSHSSSIESLSPGGDLFALGIFKNGSDSLQRSTSLESWLTSYKSNEDLFSCHSSGDISVSSGSVGELSKRTLDLLNRLENIQSPSEQKIKRSVSDITLQSCSQKMSFPGQLSLDIASSINEDSPASLTELSSSDELSLCSEDIVLHKNKIPESNASFRKRLPRSVADESDVNVSMIVNVSCTSACTDDEDDSDLLSSSTLTLTEEELCIKDEDDDSSIATDDEIYEECNLMSGLDYIKNELQTWIRPKFSLTREKRRCNLSDEVKGSKDVSSSEMNNSSDTLNTEALLNGSIKHLSENNGNSKNLPHTCELGTKGENKKNIFKVNKDPYVADMENGNIESIPERQEDKLNEISKESENLGSTGKGISESEHCKCKAFMDSSDDSNIAGKEFVPQMVRHLPKTCQNHHHVENQSAASTPTEKPCPELPSETRVINRQDSEVLKSSSNDAPNLAGKPAGCCLALEQNETEENVSISDNVSCCNCDPDVFHQKDAEDCSVHDFVKEIIDMASTALKCKSQPENEAAAPTSLTQIKEKVLEHSHRPIQLRKGDFYSYLSLSSHDSDCGEVTNYIEEKSNTPLPPDMTDSGSEDKEDTECFFEACVEEDPAEYPSCFSSALPNEPAVPSEAPGPLQAAAGSSTFSDTSLLVDDADMMALSGPPPPKRGDVGKEVDGLPQASNVYGESSELTTPSRLSGEKESSENPDESGRPEEHDASSAQSRVPGFSSKAKPPKDTAALHPNPKTLTCEENLLNLHEERHRNMHR
ncbi:A-kinase anchor protein 6 isoform X1 [Eubalaena glacialis]|uniref:A-kinase anchor protein 6 isoform X1 n=1 Tax=Eubalaena glacialis TaxID=27606 RepID=UPI002A5A50BC|nr:A-kinase anchor protein 6 isoform X1 [Eubalaena glacialis]XP_061036749.1 A-kinase anchor protein 6 isoform X1 [Eubalaena glacialis]XP_061036750.1 A-kinase anchor protein 6 isoform X1 [Eubalaena glacialis]XP_061036751.1 A-kinase anchor protein 6 isoform X1 [Eubalaena glacialis]XP_061036753.1 A-kinase anchor protein 6 isoform X1 [Eubalaena glacialis]XP_061036754.1 A-kinase anchor protein 6 isoform X1 [Eubalaena glacialis]XP_061036755.1 A-kinase anchor protein 6 isoform X1 [Eubalaena glaciali